MPTIRLRALDTLFFRDGKPFSMGDDSFAEGVFPPSPSVIYGALRSAYISQNLDKKSLEELIEESEALEITGIYFYNNESGRPLRFPMPLDYVQRKSNKSDVEVLPLKLVSSDKRSVSNAFSYLSIVQNNEHVEAIHDGVFEPSQMETYLDGNTLTNNKIDTWEKLLKDEFKYGNKRNNETRSTGNEDGALYRVGLKRLHNIELIISYKGVSIDLSVLKLGAEGKIVDIQEYKGSIDLEPVEFSDKYFKVVLFSPAIFDNGSIPNLNFTTNGKKVELKLINAIIGKPKNIGGWDIANKRPKSMLKAVPAGSVYYYEILSNHTVEEVYRSTQNKFSISDYRKKEGFGLFTIANLKFDENLIKND